MRDSGFYLFEATWRLKYGVTDIEFPKFCGVIFVINGTSVFNCGIAAEIFHHSLSLELPVILG
jgi:hypothetical protein